MKYTIKRDKDDLVKFMKTKADKEGLSCVVIGEEITIEAKPGEDSAGQTQVPVVFKGKIKMEDQTTIIQGKTGYGFYLSTLVCFAAILIVIRLIASIIQKQIENIILCGVVTLLLIIVVAVVNKMGKPLKSKIEHFFENLEKK